MDFTIRPISSTLLTSINMTQVAETRPLNASEGLFIANFIMGHQTTAKNPLTPTGLLHVTVHIVVILMADSSFTNYHADFSSIKHYSAGSGTPGEILVVTQHSPLSP